MEYNIRDDKDLEMQNDKLISDRIVYAISRKSHYKNEYPNESDFEILLRVNKSVGRKFQKRSKELSRKILERFIKV